MAAFFLPFFEETAPPKAGKDTRSTPALCPPLHPPQGGWGDVTAVSPSPGPVGPSPGPAPHVGGGSTATTVTAMCKLSPTLQAAPEGQAPRAVQTPALGQHPPQPSSGPLAPQSDGGPLGFGDEQEGTTLRPQRVTTQVPQQAPLGQTKHQVSIIIPHFHLLFLISIYYSSFLCMIPYFHL